MKSNKKTIKKSAFARILAIILAALMVLGGASFIISIIISSLG